MKKIITKVAGVTYGNAQQTIKGLAFERLGKLELLRQPYNRHDRNAIRVNHQDRYLGFVPQKLAKELAPRMDLGGIYEIRSIRKNVSPQHEIVGLTIEIIEVAPPPEHLLNICMVENG